MLDRAGMTTVEREPVIFFHQLPSVGEVAGGGPGRCSLLPGPGMRGPAVLLLPLLAASMAEHSPALRGYSTHQDMLQVAAGLANLVLPCL
jgi:hypothetical protein